MEDLEAEMIFKRVEVAVAMQEGVAAFNTKCCNEAVDRFTNGNSLLAERAVVSRRGERD